MTEIQKRTRQLHCPRCEQTLLYETYYANVEIDVCPRCAGLWCEPGDWHPVELGPHPNFGDYQQQSDEERAPDIRFAGQSALQCPACQRRLAILKAGVPPICEIDQCDHCGGIWLDHQEWAHLEAIQDWPTEHSRINAATTWVNWWWQLLSAISFLYFQVHIYPSRQLGLVVRLQV